MQEPQVAIVGGGPVGLGLAVELAQRGVAVVVLERHADLQMIPKGQNLTQRSAEHLRAWGVLDAVEAARPIPASFGTAGVTAYGTLLGDYHYRWMARSDVSAFYSENNLRIPQYEVERALRDRLQDLENAEVRLGHTVAGLSEAKGRPRLAVEVADGDGYSLAADYVVCCDGARSATREAAGIGQAVRSHRRRMILSVFESDALNDLLGRYPGMSYFNALHPDFGGYWQFLGRVDMRTWFFHAPVPPDSTLETVDPGACLARAVGQPFAFQQLYLGFWDLRFAIADRARSGNVFVAGDAAHSHPPYGGYGVNTGFEDARNLGWKLAAKLNGRGTEALLDSYDAERRPVFTSTIDKFIGRMIDDDKAFLEAFDPARDRAAFEAEWGRRALAAKGDVDAFCPNYRGSPVVAGESGDSGERDQPSAVGAHAHTARAGYLLPPKDDVMARLGDGFCLVLVGDAASAGSRFAAAAADLGVPLDVVALAATPETRKWAANVILVRPDRFVAFAANDLSVDAGAVLRRACALS